LEVTPHRLLHVAGRWADVPVIQVQNVAIDGEAVADFRPVVFVLRDLFGRAPRDGATGRADTLNGVVLERGRRGGELDETPSVHWDSMNHRRTGVKGLAFARSPFNAETRSARRKRGDRLRKSPRFSQRSPRLRVECLGNSIAGGTSPGCASCPLQM